MPADPILTLAWLVLAHLVADFIVQTGAVVSAKNSPGTRGWLGLGAHGLGVAACLIPVALAFGRPGLWTLVAIAVAHVIIDRTKITLTRRTERRAIAVADRRNEGRAPAAGLGRAWTPLPAAYFAIDQAAHLTVTLAAWVIWLSGQAPTAEWATAIGNLLGGRELAMVHEVMLWLIVVIALLIANIRAGALFVATLVRPTELGAEIGALAGDAEVPRADGSAVTAVLPPRPPRRWDVRVGPLAGSVVEESGAPPPPRPPAQSAIPPPAQVGATIGILERLLIVMFMLASAEAAIGFVIAAKTIARFRLLDDRDFAEYYLLGTLGSVSVAIVTGLVARAALAA
ncbi:MAG: DUF3307 domain-containing protein [Chloroflexota bacterium]